MSSGPEPSGAGWPDPTDDAVLGGRLRLLQPRRGHRAGTDAILLAAAIPASSGDHVVDLGAGVGTAGLAVLARVPQTQASLIEIDPELAMLAAENAARNGMADRVRLRIADVAALGLQGDISAPASADHLLANPPFHPTGGRASTNARTEMARRSVPGLLTAWVKAAARLARAGGTLTVIHRPEPIAELLAALDGRFGGLSLRFVHAKPDSPAVRLLLGGEKGSRAPLRVLPPLMLQDGDGRFTAEAEAVHRDAVALRLHGS